jgi:beta-glucanase (GH16 family)
MYGKFYFKAKLDGLVTSMSRPAIWLYDEKSLTDVMQGNAEHPFYYEIDIELFKKHLGYTIWYNHNGGQQGATVRRSLLANHKLYRKLQKEYHLLLIDWSKKWIRFYINGILTAKFRNEIHKPMVIIMGRCSMQKVIVKT